MPRFQADYDTQHAISDASSLPKVVCFRVWLRDSSARDGDSARPGLAAFESP